MDDIDIEQQLLLGSWREQEIRTGRNFLELTRKAELAETPEAKVVLEKEKNFRSREAQKKFVIKRVIPIVTMGVLSVALGLSLSNYFSGSYRNTEHPSSPVSQVQVNTPATTSIPTPPPPHHLDVPISVDAAHAQVKIQGKVMCTADVRSCPDGKMVTRMPPSCEFAPCAK